MRCATLTPLDATHVQLAVETARAGGIALVDAVHAADGRGARCVGNARALVTAVSDDAHVGVRLTRAQIESNRYADVIDTFAAHRHWIVLAASHGSDLLPLLTRLQRPGREIWLEAGSGADLAAVDITLPFAGWIGTGAEAGGLCGVESTFVLAQRLAAGGKPFFLRGGIGLHSAAAARVAGAEGVVLDDLTLLLRESALPPRWRHVLARMGTADTSGLAPRGGRPVRVVDRPDVPASRALHALAESGDDWDAAIASLVGWDEPERRAWPVGEMAAQAASIAARYPTVARLIRAVVDGSAEHVRIAAADPMLAPGAPLAASHGTAYPLVQGPMTRVSDTAAFACAVADGGALPFLALALMRGPQAATLLEATAAAAGSRPWGAGILGFVPPELRREQLDAIERVRPPFALIAGGRPDQAAALEAIGIHTYLHVPAPLLKPYLAQGARRMIFEGAECGGHIGPLHSFALWDYAVEVLLSDAAARDDAPIHVLFAGGIHDARSAAMVSALAAPLAGRRIRAGALMGTAYLFTTEAHEHGAITGGFQRVAVDSGATATIRTGPGHVIRCAPTPFVDAFEDEARRLRADGLGGAALADALDTLIVGRSRVASKGLERRGDTLQAVDAPAQYANGLFMLGEAAALRAGETSIARLHDEVCAGGARILAEAAGRLPVPDRQIPPARPADVAIVGASCLVPGASDVDGFWRNLLDGVNAIREIPRERWDSRLYYDADQAARDRIYSRWGGFVDPIPFDPVRYGIPPRSLTAITIPQLLALELTRRALADASFGDQIPDPAVRRRTAVVFGIGNTADVEQFYQARAALPLLLGRVDESVLARMPEWTEESYPGLLASVVAGRVANRFDLGGPNLTVDAACASSLAALDVAVREVADGRSDVAIAGGLEFEMSPQAYMGFSRTRALSPRGRADVFDRGADGIVISEGGVVLVLKRLADAERDGDRVYAVIKSVAGASDGRGLSLTAPRTQGQRLALDRAYEAAGVDPASIALYEAHGTGTALGDAAEVASIDSLLREHAAAPDRCAIGSLKSLLGHTRTAAGMLAVLKAALSLHHRVRPAHAGIAKPVDRLAADDAPICTLSSPEPWLSDGAARRAGVSAFGFGGTNFHVVLEEHRDAREAPAGASRWPCELFVFAAPTPEMLAERLRRAAAAGLALESSANASLADVAHACAVAASGGGPHRAAFTASSAVELRARAEAALRAVDEEPLAGVHAGSGAAPGGLAFLFPGQGSQQVGMGRELALYAKEMRDAFDAAGGELCRIVMPPAAFDDEEVERQNARLTDTRAAQPALGAVAAGLSDLARRAGLVPDAVTGHSYGELAALYAAGSLDLEHLLRVSRARADAMAAAGAVPGAMAVVQATRDEITTLLPPGSAVAIANINAPDRIVVSGPADDVLAFAERARTVGRTVVPLRVSAAFHSSQMADAVPAFAAALASTAFAAPAIPVFSNADGRPFPAAADAIRATLAAQLESPVDFVATIESMYAAGIRTFVELGPGRVLTGLVRRILGHRDHVASAAGDGMLGFLDLLARLFAAGHGVNAAALFEGRAVSWIDLDQLPQAAPAGDWLIDGGRVWPRNTAERPMGIAPFLDLETAAAASPATALAPIDGSRAAALQAYREYEQTMRQFLEQQERLLRRVLGDTDAALEMPPPVTAIARADAAPAVEPSPRLAPAADPDTSPAAILARVTHIFCDRTGYAPAMLGPDLDLEADLGIDSIKRMEVLATLLSEFPERIAAKLQGELDRLTRQRSLNAIVDLVARAAAAQAVEAAAAAAPATAVAVARFVMATHERPLDPPAALVGGLHLVTEDGCGIAPIVVDVLRSRGAEACLVADEDLADVARLQVRLTELRAAHGPVRGIVHLTPACRRILSDTPGAWHGEARVTTKWLFRLLHHTADDLDRAGSDAVVLAVTGMGGDWGRRACPPGTEMAAGCHGLLRSFQREYPDLHAAVIDIDPDRPAAETAGAVADEFLSRAPDREVGYRAGLRIVFAAKRAPLDTDAPRLAWPPAPGSVVLVTGGARGVTAEICRDVAGPGVRLVIAGRTPAAQLAESARAQLRAFESQGAIVEYHAVDLRDDATAGALVEDVYARHGRIDGVLHGAGLIDDQRVSVKSEDSFDRVFDTKVTGALALARHLRPAGLAWVVFFSSVSGRFGNPGQGDYGAANETLNRLAWTLQRRWPATRVVSINWGPWRGTGMMSDAILKVATARGLQPIDVAAGRRFLVDELRFGAAADVEVIAGDGPWAAAAASETQKLEHA